MIKSKIYNSLSDASAYLSMLKDYYSNYHGFDLFYGDNKKSLKYTIDSPDQESTFFISTNNNKIDGHIAVIRDRRLPDGVSLFGFFECTNDTKVFNNLWASANTFAHRKGVKNIIGPVNSSTFYQYRLNNNMLDAYPLFLSEPMHRNYYYELFINIKGVSELKYYSGLRTKFDSIINATKESYTDLLKGTYEIEAYNDPSLEITKKLYSLSNKIFGKNWMYLPISEQDFMELYDQKKIDKHISAVYICRWKNRIVGFSSTLTDGKRLIIKTLGVDPEFQEMGIGNALVHKIHIDAQAKGYKDIIYALIEEKNRVKLFTRDDAVVIREYSAFNFIIKE